MVISHLIDGDNLTETEKQQFDAFPISQFFK